MNTLILCNGKPPPNQLFEDILAWADLFIAADGGGNIARTFKSIPDYVIGDLDSFEPNDEENIKLIRRPSQETNDLEKALALAEKKGSTHVKVLAATGLRLDQTLKNLSVLKQFDAQFQQLQFTDAFVTIRLLPSDFSGRFPLNTTVSLFPLSGKVTGIKTEGLKYALHGEALENGIRDGSSNLVVSNPVSISHQTGDLLLFVAK